MYKKISLALLPFLASCSLIGSAPTDFTSMYKAHVSEQVTTIREFAHDMGYMESYQIDGMIKGAVTLPGFLSGTLSSEYSAKTNGKDTENTLKNLAVKYSMFGESGQLDAKEMNIITKGGDFFMNYADLNAANLMTPEMVLVMKKYEKKWLAMTQTEMMGEDGNTGDAKIAQALSSLTLTEIEDYLTRYPIFQETKDLGMVGDLHSYEVTLAKENIVALMKEFTKKATGKDMAEADIKSIQDDLAKVDVKGVMTFDPKNPKVTKWDGTITDLSASGMVVRVKSDENEKGMSLNISADAGSMDLVYERGADANTIKMTAKEGTEELAKLDAKFTKKGEKIARIDAKFEAPSQGLTVTLEHVNNDDHSFEGKLNAGIGNITWKGKLDMAGLRELKITGAMVGSSLLLDLKDDGNGTLKGPLSVKSGETPVVDAAVEMKAEKEKFRLALDIANPEDPSYKTHAEIDVTGKRSSWDGTITAPSPTVPFSTMSEEIQKLSPQTPIEDLSGGETLVMPK